MPSDRPLIILHIAVPAAAGGLESVLLELTGGLRQLGHRLVLAAVLDPGVEEPPMLRRAEGLGVEVLRLKASRRAYWQEFRQLLKVMGVLQPDVVHTHGYRADLIGGMAARHTGVPWVATAHGFVGGDRKSRLYEWLQVRSHRRAQAVVAVSTPIRERLVRAGVGSDRVHVLPNALAPKPLLPREAARGRLGLEGDEPVIGWVGRLTREKGADVFLEALALLPSRRWRAAIIGDGRERSALEARAQASGLADRVRWHGLVPEAAGLYSAFDIWVSSSRTEGTPIALLEAMAARIPAVVTAVGGVPDVVSSAEALLVAPEAPGALATAIASAISDPAAGRLRAESAYRRVVGAFAPERWLEVHLALYRALGSTNSSGA